MITITRTSDDGKRTTGELVYGDFNCKTLELPWLQNQTDISCIPAGIYECQKITSPSLGVCIEIIGVPSRTYVRIHRGNFTRSILGCILVGGKLIDFDGDGITDITKSKDTLTALMGELPDKFMLEVASPFYHP